MIYNHTHPSALADGVDCDDCCPEGWPDDDDTPDGLPPNPYTPGTCPGPCAFVDVCIRGSGNQGCIGGGFQSVSSGSPNKFYPNIPAVSGCSSFGRSWDPGGITVDRFAGSSCTFFVDQLHDVSITVLLAAGTVSGTYVAVAVTGVAGTFWFGELDNSPLPFGPWTLPYASGGTTTFFAGGEAYVKMCEVGTPSCP